ncbi:MAG: ribonuclease E/G, partial [Lachnospiraceae bacterium]|nr:ribonuclease E/G [Lachnospiraceae bacterium]
KEKCRESVTASRRVIAKRLCTGDGIYRLFMLMEEKRIVRFLFEKEDGLKIGDIYLGRAVDHAKNIKAFYLDIGRDEKVFMQTAEKTADKRMRLMRVVSLPYGSKLAKVSEKLGLPADEEEKLKEKAAHMNGCGLLKGGPDGIRESLAFLADAEDSRWLSEDELLWKEATTASADNGRDGIVPELYSDPDVPLDTLFDVRKRLGDITKDRVHLPSGGEIVISPTEAMYVIDVNTSGMTAGKDREETFLKINLEAAECIAWQIGARNMSGIIIADMINMKDEENVTILLAEMKKMLGRTEPPAIVADITKLGLAEISRSRKGNSIYDIRHILNSTILT